MAVIQGRDISLGCGGDPLLDGVSLRIEKGERVCLIGRNGAGKTTLLRILSGELQPDRGEVIRSPGLRIRRLPQEVPVDLSGSVMDILLSAPFRSGGEEWDRRNEAEQLIDRLGLTAGADVATLSAGLRRRTFLARCLMDSPDLLLLDEPTNHLDIEAITRLEEILLRCRAALLFITHDRVFLRRLGTRILELDRGRLTSWNCGYDRFLQRREMEEHAEAARLERLEKKLVVEERWIRQGLKARRTRNEGRVRALLRLRRERAEWREKTGDVCLRIQEARRTGRLVMEAENISYAWEGVPVIRDFSTIISRWDKIGIIGPNGAGKTTLLSLLLGRLTPDRGRMRHGTHLEVAVFDQLREQLDEEKTVQQNISGGNDHVIIDGKPRHVIGYLKDFLFPPERARAPVSTLSGGERNRLLLARLFARPANVLVLDEPTNDLDVETLELLEDLLVRHKGTVLVVSHDRAFLNNAVTGILALEGEGRVMSYAGGWDDMEAQRAAAASAKGADPPVPAGGGERRKEAAGRPVREGTGRKGGGRPLKLSYKETREREALPDRISLLEAEIQVLTEKMADPVFYQGPGEEIAAAGRRLNEAQEELNAAFERWEELESRAG